MDPIANLLTNIRNAQLARLSTTSAPYSKSKESICKILKNEGYIDDYKISKQKKSSQIQITLRYINKEPAITKIKRISKPSLRLYTSCKKMPRVLSDKGLAIISSSQGIITARQAKKLGVGGEIICFVY
jgi:small subunit ribosomal protein S8